MALMNKNSTFIVFLILLVIELAGLIHYTQSVSAAGSYGAQGIGPIAPAVTNCPKPMANLAMLCPVGSTGAYSMYVSYNGGAYELLP
jgi:hypothetical protein